MFEQYAQPGVRTSPWSLFFLSGVMEVRHGNTNLKVIMVHTSRHEESPQSSRLYRAVLPQRIANSCSKSEVRVGQPDGPRVMFLLDTRGRH